MNVLFAHDHIFYKHNNLFYSNGGLSKEVLKRYSNVFKNVKVVSRQMQIEDVRNNLTLASSENIEFIGVPNFKSINTIWKIKEAKRIIEAEIQKADCLIVRLPSMIGNIAIKFARKYNKPYLVEVVGCAWDASWNYGNIYGKIIAPFSFIKNRLAIKRSNYTIYITKEFLQNRYPTNGVTAICPNVNIESVDIDVLLKRKQKIKKQNGSVKFGLIGSLDVSYKGHETVIKALSQIKDEIPDFKIEFLGKGNTNKWRKLARQCSIEDNVKFLGTLPSGEEVYRWIDSIDISLQPSLAEAQGRSIIEAMSRGCPVISSRVGGIVELIDDEWLIKPGDYKELAKKIKKLISNKENQTIQAERNFNEAQQYYKQRIEDIRYKFLMEFMNSINNNRGKL